MHQPANRRVGNGNGAVPLRGYRVHPGVPQGEQMSVLPQSVCARCGHSAHRGYECTMLGCDCRVSIKCAMCEKSCVRGELYANDTCCVPRCEPCRWCGHQIAEIGKDDSMAGVWFHLCPDEPGAVQIVCGTQGLVRYAEPFEQPIPPPCSACRAPIAHYYPPVHEMFRIGVWLCDSCVDPRIVQARYARENEEQRHTARCICDPDYRYGYDDRCRVHGYASKRQ